MKVFVLDLLKSFLISEAILALLIALHILYANTVGSLILGCLIVGMAVSFVISGFLLILRKEMRDIRKANRWSQNY